MTAKEIEKGIINTIDADSKTFVMFRYISNEDKIEDTKIKGKFFDKDEYVNDLRKYLIQKVEKRLANENRHYFEVII